MNVFNILVGSGFFWGLLITVLIDFIQINKKKKELVAYLKEEEGKGTTDRKLLKFEYKRCQEMVIHYDNMNWQIGSILVGSNIVALGLSLRAELNPFLLGLSIAGMVSMFLWAFWYFRHMALYNLRNDRMYVIEKKLGLRQNLMVHEIRENCSRHQWLGIISGHKTTLLLTIFLAGVWYARALIWSI